MEATDVRPVGAGEHEAWNRFVDESPQGDVFCTTWWLEAATGGDYRILAIRRAGRIEAGFVLPFFASGSINEPFLTRTLGVLFRPDAELSPRARAARQRAQLTALLEAAPLDRFVQSCLSYNVTDWLPFRWKGLQQTTRYTYLVDVAGRSEAELWAGLSRNQAGHVRTARRAGITVRPCDDPHRAYDFTLRSFARQGARLRVPFEAFRRIDEALGRFGHRAVLEAVGPDGRVHAVDYWACRPGRSAYRLLAGADPEARSRGGHCLLLWSAIALFRHEVAVVDFGGSDLQPIERHFRDFGGRQTPYFHIFNPGHPDLAGRPDGIRYHARELARHARGLLRGVARRLLSPLGTTRPEGRPARGDRGPGPHDPDG